MKRIDVVYAVYAESVGSRLGALLLESIAGKGRKMQVLKNETEPLQWAPAPQGLTAAQIAAWLKPPHASPATKRFICPLTVSTKKKNGD